MILWERNIIPKDKIIINSWGRNHSRLSSKTSIKLKRYSRPERQKYNNRFRLTNSKINFLEKEIFLFKIKWDDLKKVEVKVSNKFQIRIKSVLKKVPDINKQKLRSISNQWLKVEDT